jgi:hypothetical protein
MAFMRLEPRFDDGSAAIAQSVKIVVLALSHVVAIVLYVVAAVRRHSPSKMPEHLDTEAAVEVVDDALFPGTISHLHILLWQKHTSGRTLQRGADH